MIFPIFISSADSYSDIWPIFFALFKKMWPEYNGIIYLNTQEKDFSFSGLNIVCTKTGKNTGFGKDLLEGLKCVKEERVLFMMIDYIFMGPVNHQKIQEYFSHFIISNQDSLLLCCHDWTNSIPSIHPDFKHYLPPSKKKLFSYQIAFWKKKVLESIILPHESPWLSEWYGDMRCEKMNLWIECLKDGVRYPIPYDLRGCLHQGRWLDEAILWLNTQSFNNIDYKTRGLYSENEVYKSLRFRIVLKLAMVCTGIKGSYWDLLKRKPIH